MLLCCKRLCVCVCVVVLCLYVCVPVFALCACVRVCIGNLRVCVRVFLAPGRPISDQFALLRLYSVVITFLDKSLLSVPRHRTRVTAKHPAEDKAN